MHAYTASVSKVVPPSPYDAPTVDTTSKSNYNNDNSDSTLHNYTLDNSSYSTTQSTPRIINDNNYDEHVRFLQDRGYIITKKLGSGCKCTDTQTHTNTHARTHKNSTTHVFRTRTLAHTQYRTNTCNHRFWNGVCCNVTNKSQYRSG